MVKDGRMYRRISGSIAVLAVCVLACAPARVNAQEPDAAVSGKEKVLVVYYSRDGHTQKVAEQLAKKFRADIERLVDLKKRTGPTGTAAAGKDALAGHTTVIAALAHDPAQYDIILLGTPSWFSNPTPAVRTFVLKYPVAGKRVGLFGTAHMTGVAHCLQELAQLISRQRAKDFPRLPLVERDLQEQVLSQKIDIFYAQVMAE